MNGDFRATAAQRAKDLGAVARRRLSTAVFPGLVIDRLPLSLYVDIAYNVMLRRAPDEKGKHHYMKVLGDGEVGRLEMLDMMRGSEEFRMAVPFVDLGTSLHQSRCDFVRSLPRAARILDIGGTHQSSREGAFVHMGYPYPFDHLVILDLPHEERHEIYRHSERVEEVDTPLGPVSYSYGSMADLSQFDDATFDLVYSGQSLEHVTPEDCDRTLPEVWRVLRPGGWFALDTPNAPVCRLQTPDFIDPDHKAEYSHRDLSNKLTKAGFQIVDAKGLNYLGWPATKGCFSVAETARHFGMYAEIEDCYLLAYLTRKRAKSNPRSSAGGGSSSRRRGRGGPPPGGQ